MRAILGGVLAAVLVVAAGVSADDKDTDKVDAKKLVGKWELADAPKGLTATVEFTKDGKVSLNVAFGDKSEKSEGTYKVDGNKLTVEMKKDGKDDKETMTITRLTDTELVTKDDKGKEEKFKRVKASK